MKLSHAIAALFFRRRWRGQMRVYELLLSGQRIETTTKHGLHLQLDPTEYVDGFVLRYGFYEQEVLTAALSHLSPGDVFWDIGSNLGLHALTVKLLRPEITVFAFEPNPRMAALIESAGRRNNLAISLQTVALDATSGHANFYLHQGNAGKSGLHNWDDNPDLAHITVQKSSGDQLVAENRARRPNVIKLDVEGNESRVLEGMRELLAHPSLHTVIFEDTRENGSPIKTSLRQQGFIIEKLTRQEPSQHNLDNYVAHRETQAQERADH